MDARSMRSHSAGATAQKPLGVSDRLREDVTSADFFLLRTPALPADEFLRWTSGVRTAQFVNATTDQHKLENAWNEDVRMLRDRLRQLVDRREVYHALFIASPSLHLGIDRWKKDPDSKEGIQAERALVRYFTRMCSRATPFGLFSGCSIGRISRCASDHPALQLKDRQFYKTTTRLDFDYHFALTDALNHDQEILKELRFSPNTSLHEAGGGWHYVEATPNGLGSSRTHDLVRIEPNVYVEAVLARAASGKTTFSELVDAVLVHDDPDISRDDAEAFVQELIETNVLVSSLSPLVTSDSPFDELIDQLQTLSSGRQTASVLSQVKDHLTFLDSAGNSLETDKYRGIMPLHDQLPAKYESSWLYQVDMTKPSELALLTPLVVDALVEAVEILSRLHERREAEPLTSFRNAFIERYDRALVPLLDALNEDVGIGFGPAGINGSTALNGLMIQGEPPSENPLRFTKVHNFLLDKIMSCLQAGTNEVRLQIADIPDFRDAPVRLPSTFSMSVELIASSQAALQAGDFEVLVNGTGGPCGAKSMTRFCHAEPQLTEHLRQYYCAEQESEPEGILAEIVHLPEGRFGNVICRPVLREHEIVFLGRSGAPEQCQILASDLLVTVDWNNEVCLYSRTLGKRVIPRLASAHMFYPVIKSPVYSFLALLQSQHGATSPSFSWGLLAAQRFLPRVTVGRIIIATARWLLSRVEIDTLLRLSRVQSFVAAQELRERRGLPRFVEYKETGDNILLVDFDNPLSVDAFIHILRRKEGDAVLREAYPGPEQLCATSEEGRFWHELDIPMLYRPTKAPVRRPTRKIVPATDVGPYSIARSSVPGSEWLFFKVYGGWAALDKIISSHIYPTVHYSSASEYVSQWFFIRYSDPQPHLRLRFRGDPARLHSELMPLLSQSLRPFIESGILWKFQVDTYIREIERYGGEKGTCLSEEIFHADSEAVVELINSLPLENELDSRWRLALLGTSLLLSDFDLNESERLELLRDLRSSYDRKFNVGPRERKTLGERYRENRAWADAIRNNHAPKAWEDVWESATKLFGRRSLRIRKVCAELRDLEISGELLASIPELTRSYMHMHINRMMRTRPNEHELVIYDFLYRLHDGPTTRSRRAE